MPLHKVNPLLLLQVEFRGLADGAQRRSVMGSSSASSMYPIPECPEHKSQLGDLSVYQKEPVLTAVDATEANKKFEEYIAGKKLTKSSRSEFAKHNLGMTGMINPTGLDINMVYPPMMHRTLNSLASICLRINTISKSAMKTENCWLKVIKPYARKIDNEKRCVKFDEIGTKAFFNDYDKILKAAHFTGIIYDILKEFLGSVANILPNALGTMCDLSRPVYEIKMRGTLGCAVFIFGRKLITPAMKQLIAHTGYYIDQAKADAQLAELPCGLGHFSDSVMEGAHKRAKQGKFIFSGGRLGKTGKTDYQKRVIEQQFLNEWFRGESTEMKNSAKRSVNRQLDFENEAVENQTKVILKSECYKLPRQGVLSIKRCVWGGGLPYF